jgi:hypothetical protein
MARPLMRSEPILVPAMVNCTTSPAAESNRQTSCWW